ncbi:MAG: hypothetical protein J3K34DRAFT_448458 [Monoraphidium minutum]|nr:MAG: hypothetical protein J3K34DRAFT_448458 [Monoraphidium minutum]
MWGCAAAVIWGALAARPLVAWARAAAACACNAGAPPARERRGGRRVQTGSRAVLGCSVWGGGPQRGRSVYVYKQRGAWGAGERARSGPLPKGIQG